MNNKQIASELVKLASKMVGAGEADLDAEAFGVALQQAVHGSAALRKLLCQEMSKHLEGGCQEQELVWFIDGMMPY